MVSLYFVDTVYLFTPKYPPSKGGAATFYSNLINTTNDELNYYILTEYKPDVSVITRQEGVSVYRILPRVSFLPRFFRVLLEVAFVTVFSVYILVKEEVDIIHAHASSFSVVSLALVSTISRVPLAYDCRDEGFRPWIVRMGHTPVWFSCASNIDDILVRNGVPEDRIIRLPVVNPDYVRDYRSIADSQTVSEMLYIGSLREAKGIFLLLEAFEIIRERGLDLHLTVIGDGPAREEFEKRCHEIDFGEHVTLTGSTSHDETLRRLAESDVLVLPSESEGVPRVVLEGQDVGTPVVATAVGGIPDVINHEENGMLAEQTAESVVENVLRLVRDDELYRTVVENGIQSANERSWERVGEQLREGYSRALSGEKRCPEPHRKAN
jgi:glycosyltransferase involved in cell wall biosynthesis